MRMSDWSSDVCSSDLFARYAIHRANVLKMALQFTGWQAMRPLGRVFCDRQDAGMRTSWRLRGLCAVALLMLALAWPADARDDASGTLRTGATARASSRGRVGKYREDTGGAGSF